MPVTTTDVYWVAGLFEGEAYFGLDKRRGCPKIRLVMTDEDVVQKAFLKTKAAARVKTFPSTKTRKGFAHPDVRKEQYFLDLDGKIAVGWMMILYSLMGNRRKQRIAEVISAWKNHKRGYDTVASLLPTLRMLGLSDEMIAKLYKRGA